MRRYLSYVHDPGIQDTSIFLGLLMLLCWGILTSNQKSIEGCSDATLKQLERGHTLTLMQNFEEVRKQIIHIFTRACCYLWRDRTTVVEVFLANLSNDNQPLKL